jgi:DNA-binding SARP family transcriptional activator
VNYNLLGPLEVLDGGVPVRIHAPKQRALLSLLLIHANEVVSSDRLLYLLWAESPGDGDDGKLRFQVSRLRSALQPDQSVDRKSQLVTVPPGYMLSVELADIDAVRLERLVDRTRILGNSSPHESLALMNEALALWRGPAYSEFEYEEWSQPEIRRLTAMKLDAVEGRVDALMTLGRDHAAVGDLQELVVEHPRRERLWGALMLALYRVDRQAEALAAYQDLRRELGEGLGINPSIELQNLEVRILLQDPSLSSSR